MSNFSDFIGGGGGGGLPVNIVLGHSQTWVPPVDGNICIHVVGAGGGGLGTDGYNRGGGGAGYAKKNSLAVTTSGSFTVIVGAGGAGSLNSVTGGLGGTTSVSGTGLSATLTANGGTGATTSDNGVGGTAANGDVNNTGGAGNVSGGGAVGITGTGNAGGSSTASNPYGGSCDSVGPESLIGHGYICGGKGGDMFYSEIASASGYGPMNYSPNGTGGFLAGGGSWYMNGSGVAARCHAGNGGIGGGGGGCNNDYGASYATGGNGGNGIVIIQYLPA
jgi:hypothetical protein